MSMKCRGSVAPAAGLMASILAVACGAPPTVDPVVTLTVDSNLIDDVGGATELTITVLDEYEEKGTGVVRLTAKAGTFGSEGNNTLVPLLDGTGSVSFSCSAVEDARCADGLASITADWKGNVVSTKVYVGEKGRAMLEAQQGGGGVPVIDPTETGTFSTFSPSKVYLYGSLEETGDGRMALSSLVQPMKHFVGFPFLYAGGITIRPDGKLVYLTDKLNLASVDDFTQSENSTNYPADPRGNDQVIPTPVCEAQGRNPVEYRINPVNGDVYYSCDYGTFHDPAGRMVLPSGSGYLKKVGYNGYKLVYKLLQSTGEIVWYLYDSTNKSRDVDLKVNPNVDYMRWTASRAKPGGGFTVLYSAAGVRQLWQVSPEGIWSRVGFYPTAMPAGYTLISEDNDFVLDGDNSIFAPASSGTEWAIVRFALGGREGTIVYSEKNRPPDVGWNHSPPRLYNMFGNRNRQHLVTGP